MFRFNLKKHLPEFPDFDMGDVLMLFALLSGGLFIVSLFEHTATWKNSHVIQIIGVENLKIDDRGRWVGSNNPNLELDLSKQFKVNRVMHDNEYTVIYTSNKNYKVRTAADEICTPDNMHPKRVNVCNPDNAKNRFKYTTRVYEIIEHDDGDVYHWVCSSNFGNCSRYEVKTK